ncbi:MAG: GDSL-type esterase/lipase family protein [Oscillospiraceae bacterium]|nr:GDSL-type esterase/lipase family protein [Oscillospiraceae bacterium]MDD7430207.1 GDSL-type esterase/lipase family protein [Oscillospiraceae bacterium]MDY2848036.1 GDSL-type esterase/lipase family protein [Oscillospiraceae bacterium]
MKTKIICAALCALMCCGIFAGCADNSSASETAPEAGVTESLTEEASAEESAVPSPVVLTEENVKLTGRTELIDDTLWCAFSGTGADFVYTGKGLDITIVGDGAATVGSDNQARVAVYVNGERVVDEMIDSAEKTFRVAENDEITTSEIQIIKLSETAQSTIGIKPFVLAEGESVAPAEAKPLKIEFIGDSITCGYGVDDEVKENHFSTSTEDVTKAYAYKTAQLLDADYSMVSISGWGIISGYTNDPSKKADSQQIPLYYGKLGYSYNKFAGTTAPQDIDWDFSRFKPDIIVINLGTNDNSYVKGDKDKRAEFEAAYMDFIGQVRENNPDADIFCVLGIMGAELFNEMGEAAIIYSEDNGDDKVHFLQLPTQDGTLGYAADWHPTEATHEVAAEYLAGEIKNTLGLE